MIMLFFVVAMAMSMVVIMSMSMVVTAKYISQPIVEHYTAALAKQEKCHPCQTYTMLITTPMAAVTHIYKLN